MSSRKSSSSGESLPSSRCGERTPLRSLENENQHLSSPSSRLKSKSLLNTDVKNAKGDVSVCDPELPLHPPLSANVPQTDPPTIDVGACGHGNITFRSFICDGGEVEILGSSHCAEESIVLPKDQTVYNTCETEDSLISDSLIVQTCIDHIDHRYCNPELKDASSVDVNASCLSETPNNSLSAGDLDGKCATEEDNVFGNDCSGENNVTWKTFVCDGGEVEISDKTKLLDETIPLPEGELGELVQDSINSSNIFDSCHLHEEEHADHPYFGSGKGFVPVIPHLSVTLDGSEKPVEGPIHLTIKSFNCTGGEIEISDAIKIADETIPLPDDQIATSSESFSKGVDPSILPSDHDVQDSNDHLEHPYFNIESYAPTASCSLPISQEPCSHDAQAEMVPNGQMGSQGVSFSSSIMGHGEGELSVGIHLSEKTSPPPEEQAPVFQPLDNSIPTIIPQDHMNSEQPDSYVERHEAVVDTPPPEISAASLNNTASMNLENEPVHSKVQETPEKLSIHPDDDASILRETKSFDYSESLASAKTPPPVEAQQHLQCDLAEHSSSGISQSSEAKDSAIGSSGNGPVLSYSAEKPLAETLPQVLKVLSECPSVASALQFGLISPVVRRTTLSVLKACRDPALDQFLSEDSALEVERSLVAPFNLDPTGLWAENLESPIPSPLLNSTILGHKPQPGQATEPVEMDKKPCAVPKLPTEKSVLDNPLVPDGPLQQQLRQMAEFLILASGKMGLSALSGPIPTPAPPAVASARATSAESHSVCVGTSPLKLIDQSLNTSGQFERKREFSVIDACTHTDPLLWNVPPGSLECLQREELEQRLRSSMIMVEALVQQLAVARTHGRPSVGPPPSELREKLVQTDHTELSQTTMHRDLYIAALNRIGDLEQDGRSLQNLVQCMQDMRVNMTCLSSDTDAALSNMKQMEDLVREDHQSLVSHYGEMKSLFERSKETQTRMMQKVKDALQQRDDMTTQMEEAFTAKQAAFSVVDQLRTHCATEMSQLQKSVGSQQELLAALNTTYPEQVALNKDSTEILNSASYLLSQTVEEQSSLIKELCTVKSLLHKAAPMLLNLNEKAADALRERDEHISSRDQAVEEREQIEEELNRAELSLQSAREQIGDLNLQVTILTSEMGVLREKLTEREEEQAQLEMKVTEMSATVSSTLASHTFLEHALTAESAKLVESQNDLIQATDRADGLESSLSQSEQRVCEFSQALAETEEQLSHLQGLSQSQSVQIQQLQDVCTQLNGVREENEFLQMENELAREQTGESEHMLRENLQGLRERNIQCEDLKGELGQLQLKNRSLQEELEAVRVRASGTQLELREKLAQTVTEITLLHHTLRGVTNELHAALNDEDPTKDTESQQVHNTERRHPSSSFVNSIMVALTTEKEEELQTETPAGPDTDESHTESLFGGTSAFTRIAVTPKKNLNAQEFDPEEEQINVAELLADLGSTVTELVTTLKLVQQRKNVQLEELQHNICGLEVEQQAANTRHEVEVCELKHQLSRLSGLLEKGNQALQQKAQDEKMVMKLMSEMNEAQELITKHKTEYNEVRKEVVDLRRSLQQSQVEAQLLRQELRKAGDQAANPAHVMEEKILLLKEVERLKVGLQEAEQARVRLLERARRHQIIHQTNQQKSENELHMLNNMINRVRETLLSLPEVVKDCDQLQQLVEYIG